MATINPRANLFPVPPTPIIYADLPTNLDIIPGSGDLARVVNADAIIVSLRNIVETLPYERPYDPIGTTITGTLFENYNINNTQILVSSITAAIRIWEPRIIVISVVANLQPNQNSVQVVITWSPVYNKTQVFNTPIILSRNR